MTTILGGTSPLQGTRAVVNMSIFADSITTGSKLPGHAYYESQELCEDGTSTNGVQNFTNCTSAIENEVNSLVAMEIPVVTSANNQNDGNCSTTPARLGYGGTHATTYHTITVGATTLDTSTYADSRLSITSTFGSNYGPCVSMWAPGGPLTVAFKTTSGNSTTIVSSGGSSFASALVSGAVARLLEQYPTLSATGVWAELQTRAALRNPQPADFDPSSTTNQKLLYLSHLE